MHFTSGSKSEEMKMPDNKNNVSKTEYFRSSLKSKDDLSFLRYRQDQPSSRVRETISRPNNPKFISQTTKNEERMHSEQLREDNFGSKNPFTQFSQSTEKRNLNASPNGRKHFLENIKPEIGEYQKLHDKLNYLEGKISEMRTNLERKREEKKKYFEKQAKDRKQMLEGGSKGDTVLKKSDPLKELVSQVSYQKKFKPITFDPYSPRHNTYYVSEVVRASGEQNSLAREHVLSSIQHIKMLVRTRQPSRQELASRSMKLPKKQIHQDKKTVVFDLDETLIHCNENTSIKSDIKLPIRFPTGEIIEAGINIRPHAFEVLKNLASNFQVIVFTASHSCYANVVLNYLDPENKYIAHRLFREHCYPTSEGVYVKDLRVLNRDLAQTVLVDNAAYSYAFQIDNGIPIIPYYEGKVDYELKALQSYLEKLLLVKDVRDVNRNTFKLSRYGEFNSPEALVKQLYKQELL